MSVKITRPSCYSNTKLKNRCGVCCILRVVYPTGNTGYVPLNWRFVPCFNESTTLVAINENETRVRSKTMGKIHNIIIQVAPLGNSGLVPSTASVSLPRHYIQHLLTHIVDVPISYITSKMNWNRIKQRSRKARCTREVSAELTATRVCLLSW